MALWYGFPFIRAMFPARAFGGQLADKDFVLSLAVLCLDLIIRRAAIVLIAASVVSSRDCHLSDGIPIALHDLCIHRIQRWRRGDGARSE